MCVYMCIYMCICVYIYICVYMYTNSKHMSRYIMGTLDRLSGVLPMKRALILAAAQVLQGRPARELITRMLPKQLPTYVYVCTYECIYIYIYIYVSN